MPENQGMTTTTPSDKAASLSDVFSIGRLAADMKVSDIINTQSDFLCYKY
jgi:hypothetical protein